MEIFKELAGIEGRHELIDRLRMAWNLPTNIAAGLGKEKLYLWGAGRLGRFALKELERNGLQVSGVVTSSNNQTGQLFESTNFVSVDEIEKDSRIIVCSKSYLDIFQSIRKLGFDKYVYYEVLPLVYDEFTFFNNMPFDKAGEIIVQEREQIEKVIQLLSHDEISLEILDNVLMYRLTLDSQWIDNAFLLSMERGSQYFDKEIVKFGQKEVFLDCGGYKGETTEEFIAKCHNDYGEVVFFEPDPGLMQAAKTNLRNYENIRYYENAVGEREETAYFHSCGETGNVCEKGELVIQITSIDSLPSEICPTYIKMDIEGAEKEALQGAVETIKKHVPKLAISIYHRPTDWYEIIEFVDSLNLGYQFYVRHYDRTMSETILYCIPQG